MPRPPSLVPRSSSADDGGVGGGAVTARPLPATGDTARPEPGHPLRPAPRDTVRPEPAGGSGLGDRVAVNGSDREWTPEEINQVVGTVLDKLGVRMDLGAGKIEVSGADRGGPTPGGGR